MSVRRVQRRDPKTGSTREYWMVDVDYEHPDGRRERVRKVSPVPTKRGAEEYERKVRALLLNPAPKAKEAPLFSQFVDERWLPTYPASAGNRATTIKEKEGHLKLYLKPAFALVRLDDIRGERVDRFFADLTEKVGPKTRKNVRATLRRILASAVEWEILDTIPKLPKVKVPDSKFDHLSREESDALIAAARDEQEHALFVFALHTGARAGEQLAIEWGDVDFKNRKIIFRRSSTLGVVGPTKSGRERKLPMTDTVKNALEAIRHSRGANVFCDGKGEPLTIWKLHYRLLTASARADVRKVRWHDLRHSFASQLVVAGVSIRQVQDWLGHASITMTMRYSHLAPGSGTDLIKALESRSAPSGNLTAPEAKAS